MEDRAVIDKGKVPATAEHIQTQDGQRDGK
jgi:hypothetical protein